MNLYFPKQLDYIVNDIFDNMVRSKLLTRIHQIKRGGLGVTLDILFRTMMIEIPGMKEFYNALINDIDREDALKRYITHEELILILEEALQAQCLCNADYSPPGFPGRLRLCDVALG